MIVPDVNLLIHAYNGASPRHSAARPWWESLLNGKRPVGLSWVAAMGFIRLTTNRSVLANPLGAATACGHVRAWLQCPPVCILQAGSRHSDIFLTLLEEVGTAGNLTTDAHLAALAIEFQAELHTTDADFARFPGLSWRNPLA